MKRKTTTDMRVEQAGAGVALASSGSASPSTWAAIPRQQAASSATAARQRGPMRSPVIALFGLYVSIALALVLIPVLPTLAAPAPVPADKRTLVVKCPVPVELHPAFAALAAKDNFDIFGTRHNRSEVTVRIAPDQQADIEKRTGQPCTVVNADISDLLRVKAPLVEPHGIWTKSTFFQQYRRYADVVDYLKQLMTTLPYGVSGSLYSIGKSVKGRDIWVVRLTGKNGPAKKKQIWINGCQHAREWIALTTTLYSLTNLISSYYASPSYLDTYEWYFSPLANPDGYEYTFTADRMWRKNLGYGGVGVDLNRNWPYFYGYDWGSSSYTWSETFRGPRALSEPESTAIYNNIMALPRRFLLIDFHSYGQLILRNWGTNTYAPSANNAILTTLSAAMVNKILANANGVFYTAQTGMDLYPTSGAMDDWGASVGMVSFTIELRDEGYGGFDLPASSIVPTGDDGWAALRGFVEFAGSAAGAALGPEPIVPNDGTYITNSKPRLEVVPLKPTVVMTTKRKTTSVRPKTTTVRRKKTSG